MNIAEIIGEWVRKNQPIYQVTFNTKNDNVILTGIYEGKKITSVFVSSEDLDDLWHIVIYLDELECEMEKIIK